MCNSRLVCILLFAILCSVLVSPRGWVKPLAFRRSLSGGRRPEKNCLKRADEEWFDSSRKLSEDLYNGEQWYRSSAPIQAPSRRQARLNPPPLVGGHQSGKVETKTVFIGEDGNEL
jgi:hypothetical protein